MLAGGFLVGTADVRLLGFEATAVGLLLLTLGLGVGVAGEYAGLETGTRVSGLALAGSALVTLALLATVGDLPALVGGLALSVGAGYLLSRRTPGGT